MSWLNGVRNRIPFLPKRESTPDNLWHSCGECGAMVFVKEYEDNARVCPRCDHHGRIGTRQRLDLLLDPGFTILPTPAVREDPLKFATASAIRIASRPPARPPAPRTRSRMPVARSKAARPWSGSRTSTSWAARWASASARPSSPACAPPSLRQAPYIIVTAAGGARMQEGILSLMQMPRTTVAIAELKEAGLPYIVILTDPTTGGVTASYAMLGDIHIAEPGALIGFAGQRVIEQTIREKLPEGFQRSEYLLEHGMVDMVVHRGELKARLALLLDYLCPHREAA
jgi:acetyl-CoA carboxylase carboxyl transferase subunit beta